jgi:hypothetical protein
VTIRQQARAGWCLGSMLALLCLTGCPSASNRANVPQSEGTSSASSTQLAEIEDQLKSALYQLQPENLGIDSQLSDAVSVVNSWWSAVEQAGLKPTGLAAAPIPEDRLPAEVRTDLESSQFTELDGQYIRDAYLSKAIVDHLSKSGEDELSRIVRMFGWVCRAIAVTSEDEPLPPLMGYEALVIGYGRPEHRAWVFAKLLKQLRIDAVVLQVATESPDEAAPWIVGVLWEQQVYLFDPRLGLPVPAGTNDTSAWPDRPATLAEILQNPDWLKPLTVRSDQPYEPSAEQLQSATVHLIESPSAWAPRMWSLEQLLPGESLCVLYDAALPIAESAGAFARVAAGHPGWKADQIQLWPFYQTVERRKPVTEGEVVQLQSMFAELSMPISYEQNDKTQQTRRVETRRLLKVRTRHLMGQYSDAIGQYVTIRQLVVIQAPEPQLAPLYARAAEDAHLWSAQCKREAGDLAGAATMLTDFLKRGRRGRWAASTRMLLAETLVQLNQLPEAITALKLAVPDDDAYRTAQAILLKRWTALESKEPATPATSAAPAAASAPVPADPQSASTTDAPATPAVPAVPTVPATPTDEATPVDATAPDNAPR